jgi:hypothetical protein
MAVNTTQGNALLDAMLGDSRISAFPATLYVGLSTTTPTSTGTNITEPTGNAYARVSYANTNANWGTASAKSKSNQTAITFTTATGGWGTITYVVLFDASTGGNAVLWAPVTTSFAVYNTYQVVFAIGSFVISVA